MTMVAETPIIVINASPVLASLNRSYQYKLDDWKAKCASIRAGFHKKTSRSQKNGHVYEYTHWYIEKPGGGLQIVGKEEPDYTKYYPPEPKSECSFKADEYEGHLIMDEGDYLENQKIFKDCLAFPIEECENFNHPLFVDPEKAINSVRNSRNSSEGSRGTVRQKRDPAQIDDGCFNDGDCDNCEHNDECPVMAEEDEE